MTIKLATAAAFLVLGASAQAAPLAPVARVAVDSGPAISGDRVAYGSSADNTFTLFGATLGAAPTQLFSHARENDNGELNGVGVALSPSVTAFAFGEFLAVDPDGATAYQQAYAGPPAGPFSAIAGTSDGNTAVDAVDASGDAVLTLERTSSTRKAFVHAGAGAPAKQIGATSVMHARIAGDYVASSTQVNDTTQRVTVTNWKTDAELYHVDVPVTPPYGYGFGLDVQEDGTIAVRPANAASDGGQPKSDLAWASAAAPTLHTVATDVGLELTKISGGKILFERAHGALARELAIADLAGTVTPASFPVDYVVGADLDGPRLAFAASGCVYAGDIPATAPATAPAGTCPQTSLRLNTATTKTKGRIKVIVRCVMGTATGCDGTVTLRTPKSSKRKTLVLATKSYHAGTDTASTFTVTIAASRLKSLRNRVGLRRKTAFLDVRVNAKDEAGLSASTYRDALVRLK